ncbi:MAG: hypothetical protein JKX92_10450 [Porticoccaceae bacterium]|nr:hypothetical protein [Porticoccaceae bacterium]
MATGTIVIITVIVAILAAIIAYFVLSHLKGSLDLLLTNTSFSHGETIKGSFNLNAKKLIEGNSLYVALIAREVTEERDDEGGRDTRSREIYKNENRIDGPREYPQGFSETFSFEFTVPDDIQSEFEGSTIGQAVKLIGNMMDNGSKHIEWKIEACLDAKGIDLRDSEKIYIDVAKSN